MEKKKVLITGANSYIGTSFENHAKECFDITTVDMLSDDWKTQDWSSYDTIFHVAGIAHVSNDKDLKDLYYKVNRDLAIETAEKAKQNGVKQFIYMSSMIVYGDYTSLSKKKAITLDTPMKPKDYYGDSKMQADILLQAMQDDNFNIAIMRPPMVYGKDSKGNFPRLVSLTRKAFVFPKINNERSMIHIDNLCEIIKLVIENKASGIFFPQNKEYLSSSQIVKIIRNTQGKKVWLSRLFALPVFICYPLLNALKKLFGNLKYDQSISTHFSGAYQIIDTEESIKKSL